ncbi:hypothetical protein ACMFMF_007058 [Clarireedia jacksonii]
MRKSRIRKPPPLYVHTSSRESSPRCSSVLSDCDADDEGFMSSGEFLPSRPLSLAIPPGPYCPRRPTLSEVLLNSAPPPWTLSAFMAYLSQNHCLETLEFTMDATRYKNHYQTVFGRDPHTPVTPTPQDCEYVRMLWQKLLDAYIAPNGPREVNLPSTVRDQLMSLPNDYAPPHPNELDQAVKIIYELMDESVLVPFLNSVAPATSRCTETSPWESTESVADASMAESLDERTLSPARSRARKDRSPPLTGDSISQSYSGHSQRFSQHSHLSAALGRATSGRLSAHLSGSSGISSAEGPDSLTDDTDSPSSMEPMTPPTTPPTSDTGFANDSPGTSPHSSRGEGSWKKMGAKLGFKKSRSAHGSSSSTSSTWGFGSKDLSSDRGSSTLLEAHPGSPVDLTGRRPSLASSIASLDLDSENDLSFGCSMSYKLSKSWVNIVESRSIGAGGVAAKSRSSLEKCEKENVKARTMQAAGLPFYIPAKVPECEESSKPCDESSIDEVYPDFDFEEDNGTWISANSRNQSSSSLASIATSTSTLIDEKSGHGDALSIDTCLANSVASSSASLHSCVSTGSDIYGWEEELDRKSSIETQNSWNQENMSRRLPSGGRTMGPRVPHSGNEIRSFYCKRADEKRKSLLYRVLNISGRKSSDDESHPSSSSSSHPSAMDNCI